jgi:hypothetical protein
LKQFKGIFYVVGNKLITPPVSEGCKWRYEKADFGIAKNGLI